MQNTYSHCTFRTYNFEALRCVVYLQMLNYLLKEVTKDSRLNNLWKFEFIRSYFGVALQGLFVAYNLIDSLLLRPSNEYYKWTIWLKYLTSFYFIFFIFQTLLQLKCEIPIILTQVELIRSENLTTITGLRGIDLF